MALRRPPTAVSLKPSDVSDLQAALEKRNQAQGHSTDAANDELLRREKEEQDARERKGQRERVIGA